MNIFHRWYCGSERWARAMREVGLPRTLEGLDLGDDLLEVGPGPGVTTDWLRDRVARLTAIEVDSKLAAKLTDRLAGTNVTVVEGDATRMSFPDGSFSGAVCFTMLHHVPTPELQDRLLAETARVLRPGAPFAGMDSTPSLTWNVAHLFDTRVPVDPDTFAARLERAGFVDANVVRFPGGFAFRARAPGA